MLYQNPMEPGGPPRRRQILPAAPAWLDSFPCCPAIRSSGDFHRQQGGNAPDKPAQLRNLRGNFLVSGFEHDFQLLQFLGFRRLIGNFQV